MMQKKGWIVIAVLAFAAAGVLFFKLSRDFIQKDEAKEQYTDMRQEEKEESLAEESETEKLDIPVDFEALQKKNSDIYAWITIPGTEIDYPIVQSSTDNGYYLNHSAEKTESASGAIFSENYNSKEFDDYITAIYGHNMRDGSMFTGLHQYEDSAFLKEHQDIIIYTPNAILKYKIFAAYLSDDRHVVLYYNQGRTEDNRRAYLNEIMSQRTMKSSLDTSANADVNSKILTLSTCHSAGDDYRYLVQAYLEEKIE